MKSRKVLVPILSFCTALLLLLASCIREELIDDPSQGRISVTLNMDIPVPQQVTTRSVEDENLVNTLDILFFDAAGANSSAPLYKERRHLDYVITVEVGKIRAVVKDLPLGSYQVVVVANAEPTLFDGLTTSTTLEQAKASLQNKSSSNMPATNLLMAGESTKVEVITTENQVLSTITLVRAVARIDVLCSLKNIQKGSFELTSAEVRNARSQSYLFGQFLLADKDKVSFPPSATIVDYVRPAVTEAHPSYADTDGNILAQLYAYENSSDDNIANKDATTCLIVGGKFNGSERNTYYRIDVSNSNKKYILKRNHRYMLSITSVLGPGYATKDEAEQGLMNNIKAEIMEWVEGGSSGIMMEGDKMISVSQTQFKLEMYSSGTALDLDVAIKNLASSLFKIEQDNASSEWLEIDNTAPFTTSDNGVEEKTVQLKVKQDNTKPDARTATLKISAGGAMYLEVKVTQGNTDRIKLDYAAPELEAKAYTAEKVAFSFNDPNQNDPTTGLAWKVESQSSWITINTTEPNLDNGKGAGAFYIDVAQHPEIGYSRRGSVRLTITEGDKMYYRSIPVVQFNTNLSVDYVEIDGQVQKSLKIPENGYVGEYAFTVRSRAALTLQLDGFPAAWSARLNYIRDGVYSLLITASAVPSRATATETTLDTYRIGYINFVNNKGTILRKMLAYQGYVKALPNTTYLTTFNYATVAEITASPQQSPKGLRPQKPTEPITYELVAHGQRVWLDRNVNAVNPMIQPDTVEWPEEYDSTGRKQAGAMGSTFYIAASTIYADPNFEIDQRNRAQGPCPSGFRQPTTSDVNLWLVRFTEVDDNPTLKYLWSYNGMITVQKYGMFNKWKSATDLNYVYANFTTNSSLPNVINGTGTQESPVFVRCVSDK